jgi:hypothetical protein
VARSAAGRATRTACSRGHGGHGATAAAAAARNAAPARRPAWPRPSDGVPRPGARQVFSRGFKQGGVRRRRTPGHTQSVTGGGRGCVTLHTVQCHRPRPPLQTVTSCETPGTGPCPSHMGALELEGRTGPCGAWSPAARFMGAAARRQGGGERPPSFASAAMGKPSPPASLPCAVLGGEATKPAGGAHGRRARRRARIRRARDHRVVTDGGSGGSSSAAPRRARLCRASMRRIVDRIPCDAQHHDCLLPLISPTRRDRLGTHRRPAAERRQGDSRRVDGRGGYLAPSCLAMVRKMSRKSSSGKWRPSKLSAPRRECLAMATARTRPCGRARGSGLVLAQVGESRRLSSRLLN